MKAPMPMFDARQRDTLVAALLFWRDRCHDQHGSKYDQIATRAGQWDPPINTDEMDGMIRALRQEDL